MLHRACERMRFGVQVVRAWPVWELPTWLIVFIFTVTAGVRSPRWAWPPGLSA